MSQYINFPLEGFRSIKCPSDTYFEIVLECQKPLVSIGKIFPKNGDSIIINLDSQTFCYLSRKEGSN